MNPAKRREFDGWGLDAIRMGWLRGRPNDFSEDRARWMARVIPILLDALDPVPMTLLEAAAQIGVTPATLRQQIHNGKLRAQKLGRDWHVTPREVERYRRDSKRA